jgi:hypothetical protein
MAFVVAVVNGKRAKGYRTHVTKSLVEALGKNESWQEICGMNLFFKDAKCRKIE